MPNQYCLDVTKQISSWFWGDILGQKTPNLNDLYHTKVKGVGGLVGSD